MDQIKTKIFNKSEVAQFLGITPRALRSWSEEKIQTELLFKCSFEVLRVEKVGRQILYTCTYKEVNKSNKYILKETFKVKNIDEFIQYSKDKIEDIESDAILTNDQLCNKSGTHPRTSHNYNKYLVQHGVLSEDGYLYICIEKSTKKKTLTTEKAYKTFWHRNLVISKELSKYNKRFVKGELSTDDHAYLTQTLLSNTKGEYIYYRVSSFIVQYDNELTKLIINS